MELVYLWVEEYKNIKNQGFNFSPRFTCKYDENSKELTIKKKEHVSIFPENINVTAIVGENGSGKSGLLESMMDILSENYLKWWDEEQYRKNIVIYKYEEKYFYLEKYMDNDIKIIDELGNSIDWIEKNPNQRLLEWHSDLLALIIQNEAKQKVLFKEGKQVFVEQTQVADKNRIKKQIVINSIIDSMFKKESNKFFSPTKVLIKIKWRNIFYKDDYDKYKKDIVHEIGSKEKKAKQMFSENKNKDAFLAIFNICEMKQNRENLKKPEPFMRLGVPGFFDRDFEDISNYSCLSKIVANHPIKNVYENIINKLDTFEDMTFKVDELTPNILDFIFDLPEFIFDIELKDDNKSFEDLSFGERQLLTQLNFIQFYANKKQYIQYEGIDYFKDEAGNEHEVDTEYEKRVKSMIILLDEFEMGLHPNWQKQAINYMIDFLKNIKAIDFNLIITSHSPFILSDLPKENVIFLKNGKQDNPDIQQTFGANIHTLLSHGFFMEDGLMGEFAKGKIDEIIKNLKDKKYNPSENEKKEVLSIINIIGEEFLRIKILDMYYKKFDDDFVKKQRKKDLLEQQKKIQKELESL